MDLTYSVILKEKPKEVVLEAKALQGLDPILVKQGHFALLSLIMEAAKENADTAAIKSTAYTDNLLIKVRGVMEDVKPSLVDHFCEKYDERVAQVRRSLLARTTFHFPHIVSLDWRLDYFIKSNAIERSPVPVFFVRLNTLETGGKQGVVEFTCSWEELQDLLNKLKVILLYIHNLNVAGRHKAAGALSRYFQLKCSLFTFISLITCLTAQYLSFHYVGECCADHFFTF